MREKAEGGARCGHVWECSEIRAYYTLPNPSIRPLLLSPVMAGFSPMAVQKPGVEQRGMGREKLVLVVCRQASWCRA